MDILVLLSYFSWYDMTIIWKHWAIAPVKLKYSSNINHTTYKNIDAEKCDGIETRIPFVCFMLLVYQIKIEIYLWRISSEI